MLDKNGDGVLSRIEIIQACRRDERVAALLRIPQHVRQEDGSRDVFEAIFQTMDADDSKAIALDEFQRFWVSEVMPRITTPTGSNLSEHAPVSKPIGPLPDSMPPSPPYSSRPSSSASSARSVDPMSQTGFILSQSGAFKTSDFQIRPEGGMMTIGALS